MTYSRQPQGKKFLFKIPPKMLERLERVIQEEDYESMAWTVRQAIREFLSRHENKEKSE